VTKGTVVHRKKEKETGDGADKKTDMEVFSGAQRPAAVGSTARRGFATRRRKRPYTAKERGLLRKGLRRRGCNQDRPARSKTPKKTVPGKEYRPARESPHTMAQTRRHG